MDHLNLNASIFSFTSQKPLFAAYSRAPNENPLPQGKYKYYLMLVPIYYYRNSPISSH